MNNIKALRIMEFSQDESQANSHISVTNSEFTNVTIDDIEGGALKVSNCAPSKVKMGNLWFSDFIFTS